MSLVVTLVELAALASAILAAWLWFQASRRKVRRISYRETLDAADFNRIITALNRAQLLNSRAAVATGVSALCVALCVLPWIF